MQYISRSELSESKWITNPIICNTNYPYTNSWTIIFLLLLDLLTSSVVRAATWTKTYLPSCAISDVYTRRGATSIIDATASGRGIKYRGAVYTSRDITARWRGVTTLKNQFFKLVLIVCMSSYHNWTAVQRFRRRQEVGKVWIVIEDHQTSSECTSQQITIVFPTAPIWPTRQQVSNSYGHGM